MSMSLRPVVKKPLSQEVLHSLRQGIYEGLFPPGSRLIESRVAEQLQVSRAPVREAIIYLEQEGLIEQEPNCGARVVALNTRDGRELYALRGHLEAWAVELGWETLTSSASLERLGQILDAMRVLEPAQVREGIDLDLAFHTAVVGASDQQWLIRTYESLDAVADALFFIVRTRFGDEGIDMYRAHLPVLDAISSGSLKRARTAIVAHWDQAATRLVHAGESKKG